jgi:hypothetical protein
MWLAMTCSPIHPARGGEDLRVPFGCALEEMGSPRAPGECEVTLAAELQQMAYPRCGSAPRARKIDPTT